MAFDEIGVRVVILGVGEARRAVGTVRGDLLGLEQTIRGLSSTSIGLGTTLTRLGANMMSLGRAMTMTMTLPLVAVDAALLKSGIDFEDHFAGVTKTVDGMTTGFRDLVRADPNAVARALKLISDYSTPTHILGFEEALSMVITQMGSVERANIFTSKSFGQLTKDGALVREQFRQLALDIPIAVTELADVGELAGALGISKDQIVGFTEAMAYMGVATDMSAEESANAIARIGNIMGVAESDMTDFAWRAGSAIVDLGNKSAATESEIAAVALRIAGAGRVVGLTTPEILGISTTLAEMGLKAEMGGTAVSRLLQEMMFAIAQGGEDLNTFAAVAGVTNDEFTTMFKEDAAGAMMFFVEQLTKAQEEGRLTEEQLIAMGLSGVRVRDVMNRLGPNMGEMRENIDYANRAWNEHIALQEEAQKRFLTVASRIQMLKNHFVDLGITLFDLVKDDLTRLIDSLGRVVDQFKNLKPATQKFIFYMSVAAAAAGPLLIVLGTLVESTGTLITTFSRLVTLLPRMAMVFPAIVSSILPLVLVAGALYYAWNSNIGGIQEIFRQLSSIFKSMNFGTYIKDFMEAVAAHDWAGAKEAVVGFISALGSAFEQAGKVVIPVVNDLIQNFLGLSDVEYTNLGANISTLGSSIAGMISSIVTAGGAIVIEEAKNAINNLGLVLGGLAVGDLDQITNSLGKLFTSVGLMLLVFPVQTLDKVVRLLGYDGLSAIKPETLQMIGDGLAAMATLKIVAGLWALGSAITNLVKNNWQLLLFAAILYLVQTNTGEATTGMRDFQREVKEGDLGGALKSITPGLALVGVLMGLIAAPWISAGVTAVASAFTAVKTALTAPALITALSWLKNVAFPGLATAARTLGLAIGANLGPILVIFGIVVGAFRGYTDNIVGFKDSIDDLRKAIKDGDIGGALGAFGTALLRFPAASLVGLSQTIVDIGAGLGLWESIDVAGGLSKWGEAFSAAWGIIKYYFGLAKMEVQNWWNTSIVPLPGKIGSAFSTVGEFIQTNLVDPFKTKLGEIKEALTGASPDSLRMQVTSVPSSMITWLNGLSERLRIYLSNKFNDAKTAVMGYLFDNPDSLKNKILGLPDAVVDALKDLETKIRTAIYDPFKKVVDEVLDYLSKITDISIDLPDVKGAVEGAVESGGNWVERQYNTAKEKLGGARGKPFYKRQIGLVGERGPELFMPNISGKVVPAHSTNRILEALTQLQNIPTGGGISNTSNVYNPVFQAAPSPAMIAANRSLYEQWLMSGMGS